MLGYSALSDIHERWCDDLEENRRKYNRILLLKPRGTYKSTIYTISQVIELLMEDYVKNKQFTLRILIISATEDLATQILSEITAHFLHNDELKAFFGRDVIESSNNQSLTLMPRKIAKEPTIKARGSGAAIVGEHYTTIFIDDLANNKDRESAAKRAENAKWLQDIISIISPGGYILICGTRWHGDDVYNDIIENNKKLKGKFKYHIEIESAVDDNGNPNFPTILPLDVLESIRTEKGIVAYTSQYLNQILSSGTQIFCPEKMHFYTEYGPDSQMHAGKTIGYLDPALGREGDYIVFVIGTVVDNELQIRDVVMKNDVPVMQFLEIIKNYAILYHIDIIAVETNGFQSLVADSMRDMGLPIKDIGNRKKKEIRIEGAEPYYSSGKIRFRTDWENIYPDFLHQIFMYPSARHDDAPDALAGLASAALLGNKTSAYVDFVKNLNVTTPKFQGKELNPRLRHHIKMRSL